MRAVVITRPGGPDVLTVDDVQEPVPGPRDLLVEVAAAGVNRADLLQRAGHYPPPAGAPAWPGLEVSGTVVARGAGLGPDDIQLGDRVAALLAGGGYAERVTVPADLALRVPEAVPTVDAAALPEALATVWSNLRAARLSPGESLLVHGGSGGVGSIAVQVARALGTRVLATAGGPQRTARVLALGADVALDHREPGLVQRVREATQDRGVDVVLDVLGAGGLADNLAMLADDGRLVVIGMQQGRRGELDLAVLLTKRASVLGTTLRSRPHHQKVAIMDGVRRHVWPFVADGSVKPVVHARLGFDQAGDAHRLLETGEAFGKVLLIP
ncbi:NAD(P)H-quinone oxidoreductase [Cellulomonas fengjieae]|uniref:NAD(P)H-quinone oxidoreductase n=1 Tax=Cellulomonas fengjieae TaxID=2819978 RepID=A0ABS3SHH0_9CELL|nr:NAD(P)H-quinone oxidoreductase [Cellulomonas fengjieae]MBO3085195.1 NAD(P)H-quinone oxidoreductase [Cellulomonas fengjieae]MBO3100936.1 NAD(P)H-quinone oxidoreductase [Cellulomonas fengjieae]QVI66235.1 NAD(P)H-quinone oxidoreductase [Cellulomonas fengjieae]